MVTNTPKTHLGGFVRKEVLNSMIDSWEFSSSQHVKTTVNNEDFFERAEFETAQNSIDTTPD